MADAIIIETYGECVRGNAAPGTRFAFVTHNKKDFSAENGNQKLPHPDIASYFSRIKSLYFINPAEALRRVEPSLVTDIMLEESWTQKPRSLSEMIAAEDLLFHIGPRVVQKLVHHQRKHLGNRHRARSGPCRAWNSISWLRRQSAFER